MSTSAPPATVAADSPLLLEPEVERTLVGWLLAHPERAIEVVPDHLCAADVHGYLTHQVVRAIEAVVAQRALPHVEAVATQLRLIGVTDVSKLHLVELLDGMPRGVPWDNYARRIRLAARRRRVQVALADAQDALSREPDFDAVRARVYDARDAADMGPRPVDADAFLASWATCSPPTTAGPATCSPPGSSRWTAASPGYSEARSC